MSPSIASSRDIILRTDRWAEAVSFYETVLGLKIIYRSDNLVGFETGAFVLYVEKGATHGPVFEFLSSDIQSQKNRLLAAGCSLLEEDASVPRCYLKDPFGLTFNLHLVRR